VFISFEGIGGCGKSTQARRLFEHLKGLGKDAILTREPGGSPGAEEIRRLILEGDGDRWSPETEIILFNAARRDHLECTVWPVLTRGGVVITDRYVDSTRVYQGVARADLRGSVDKFHSLACGQETDLTIIVDVSPDEGMSRVGLALRKEQDRFDEMGMKFQKDLRDGYLGLGEEFPERCMIIDGMGSQNDVFARICKVVLPCLGL